MLATRAFKFDVKADETKTGFFSGRASVYGVVDSYGDVVQPGAFTESLKRLGNEIVILNQHDSRDPIGKARLTDSDTALLVEAELVMDLPSAKDAFTRLKSGLVTGLSIGYMTVKDAWVQNVRHLHELDLVEVSCVTFPANNYARVTDVKNALAQFADLPIVQTLLPVLADQDIRSALANAKAGRVLSASNRSKVSGAVDAMDAASAALRELLDSSDPDKAADIAAINTLTAYLRSLRNAA